MGRPKNPNYISVGEDLKTCIWRLHKYFQRERVLGHPYRSLNKVKIRVSEALGVSLRTVERVVRNISLNQIGDQMKAVVAAFDPTSTDNFHSPSCGDGSS